MYKLSSLTLFFPALNDAQSLAELIPKASKVAKEISERHELIVIDDGSTDSTQAVLADLKKTIPYLRIITHAQNEGYGAALRSGFKNAQYEWVFYTDGDGQYDVGEVPLLVNVLTDGHPRVSCHPRISCHPRAGGDPFTIDVVNGYKIQRGDGILRTLIGKVYNNVMHLRYNLPVCDVDCDFRLIRKSALDKITLASSSGSICVELISKLAETGARFTNVPVHHFPRKYGTSRFFSVKHIWKTVLELHF